MKRKFLSLLAFSLIGINSVLCTPQSVQAAEISSKNQNVENSESSAQSIVSMDSIVTEKKNQSMNFSARSTQPTIRKGDSVSAVKSMQSMLNYLSKVSDHKNHSSWYCGSADGVFGSSTVKALKNYQRDAGLTVDGVCGSATWRALERDVAYWE